MLDAPDDEEADVPRRDPDDAWRNVPEVLRIEATSDLERTGEGGLYLVACDGPDPLFVAASRPFPPGGYAEPIIELAALAALLGADRLAVGVTGRAWSRNDPIVPVADGVDLRQRILSIHLADGHGVEIPRRQDLLVPYDLVDGTVRWQEPMEAGPAEGWIPSALALLLAGRDPMRRPGRDEPHEQFERCVRLGHDIGITVHAAGRLYPELADEPSPP